MISSSAKYSLAFALGGMVVFGAYKLWDNFAFCHQEYNLLSPIRRCRSTLPQGEWDYEQLRDALSAKKEELKSTGALSHLSIYFQDLDYGPRFGIGEYDKFQPASLLKLPLAIFFLHAADLNPDYLDNKLIYNDSLGIPDNLESASETIQAGEPYTIRELLTKMIVHSDNRSYAVLLHEMNRLSSMPNSVAYETFRDLDVLQMMLRADTNYISISSYAKLYGVLYNMAYLSKDMSLFALQLLSEATFKDGIVAGVPSGLTVAHKYGFAVLEDEIQLHDCGIVYHPRMAYILCVMTSSADPKRASESISEISTMVYDTVTGLEVDR